MEIMKISNRNLRIRSAKMKTCKKIQNQENQQGVTSHCLANYNKIKNIKQKISNKKYQIENIKQKISNEKYQLENIKQKISIRKYQIENIK